MASEKVFPDSVVPEPQQDEGARNPEPAPISSLKDFVRAFPRQSSDSKDFAHAIKVPSKREIIEKYLPIIQWLSNLVEVESCKYEGGLVSNKDIEDVGELVLYAEDYAKVLLPVFQQVPYLLEVYAASHRALASLDYLGRPLTKKPILTKDPISHKIEFTPDGYALYGGGLARIANTLDIKFIQERLIENKKACESLQNKLRMMGKDFHEIFLFDNTSRVELQAIDGIRKLGRDGVRILFAPKYMYGKESDFNMLPHELLLVNDGLIISANEADPRLKAGYLYQKNLLPEADLVNTLCQYDLGDPRLQEVLEKEDGPLYAYWVEHGKVAVPKKPLR